MDLSLATSLQSRGVATALLPPCTSPVSLRQIVYARSQASRPALRLPLERNSLLPTLPRIQTNALQLRRKSTSHKRSRRQGLQRNRGIPSQAISCPGGLENVWTELQEPERSTCLDEVNSQSTENLLLSCTTFNVLAPIYKRLGNEQVRESSFREAWLPRNKKILSALLAKKSSIICLQEFWLANPELVAMYEDAFHKEGYKVLILPRPNNRGDGLLAAVKADKLEVVHQEDLLFNDCGDRVAQFLWLRSTSRSDAGEETRVEMLVVNTHLLFPHDSTSSFIRLRQVYKVLEHLESYKAQHGLGPVPIILCGDLNGTKNGQVSRFLRSQGFQSSFDIAHNYPDSDQRWVSHRNHHGVVCGVDFIWLLNPRQQHSPLSADWKAAVFMFLRRKLMEIGYCDERQAFSFFCAASDEESDFQDEEEEEKDKPLIRSMGYNGEQDSGAGSPPWPPEEKQVFTMSEFEVAVSQLGQEIGLTKVEVRELMDSVDVDGNGVVSYEDFHAVVSQISDSPNALQNEDETERDSLSSPEDEECQVAYGSFGLEVRDASLYPPETADGVWPQDYALSDHSILTAVFYPTESTGSCLPQEDTGAEVVAH